ncbi:MAG: SpoIIE family protein phosphatase [Acidimicrobiia bacterium]
MPEEAAAANAGHAAAPQVFVASTAVLDALQQAVIVTDVGGVVVQWNHAASTLYGVKREDAIGREVVDIVVPEEGRAAARRLMERVAAGEEWRGVITAHGADGPIEIAVSDHPIFDETGNVVGVVGIADDITSNESLRRRATELAEHLRLALDAGGLGTWHWDLASGVTTWDAKLAELFGLQPGEFDGTYETWVSLLHPEDRQRTLDTLGEAVATKGPYVVEHRVLWPDGTVRWLQGKGHVTLDDDGDVTGTIGCTADITDQVLAAQEREQLIEVTRRGVEQERLSRERLEFLGRVNDALAAARDRSEVMRAVTRAAVPRLGDWCSIFVLPEGGLIPDIEVAHTDPEMVAYVHELMDRFPYDPDAPTGIANVIRTRTTEFHPVIDEALIEAAAPDEAVREVVRALRLRSSIAVPLVKRGRVIGAMQFVTSATSRDYSQDDVALAEAAANRIASTLENLRLSAQQRMIASTLQASLLPDSLPEIPGVEVAVRYWPTGEGAEVGGDFYDVFAVEDHWAIVIGDVCGTGPVAASVTGLARHTIRAAARHGDDPPEVLRHLNLAVNGSGHDTFCTALYCTLLPASEGYRLSVTSGGHPLPVLVTASGTAEILGRPGTLLGALPESRSVTTSHVLSDGDIVVAYTDGVTDVRPPHDLSTVEFVELVRRASKAASSAEEVADRVHDALAQILSLEERHDDIAMMVLMVTPAGREASA